MKPYETSNRTKFRFDKILFIESLNLRILFRNRWSGKTGRLHANSILPFSDFCNFNRLNMDRYVSSIIAANILKLGYQQYRLWPTQLASKTQQP